MAPDRVSRRRTGTRLGLLASALTLTLALAACGGGGAETDGVTAAFKAFRGMREAGDPVSRTETGAGGYLYRLEGGALSVSDEGGVELWCSQEGWWVDDFRLGDVDGDGTQDFVFSLWKSYRFGEAKPARMENDDETVRNHLFLYTVLSGRVKSVWGSSDLPRPIYLFDLDPTGRVTPVSSGMLLRTQEGEYRDDFSPTEATACTYAWEGWGFVPLD
ncbi:MAG: hypothetical protein LBT60_01310 [Oscillospiraceae bacterium]|jgi:hypothetical protein|nr:hypothetical protein [Oscillospiraceae bacterium]